MSAIPSLRKRLLTLCGPALGIVLAYYSAFHSPLQRKLKPELTKLEKLEKLEAVSARRPTLESNAEKLAAAQAEVRALNGKLQVSQQIGSHLVTRRADLRSELLRSTSPAMVMSQTLVLLGRHGLECIDSSPVAVSAQSVANISDSLKPVAELLGGAGGGNRDGIDRREMRVTLRGRFQDIQSALHEMQDASLGVFMVSLEMVNSEVHTDHRIWILTISV